MSDAATDEKAPISLDDVSRAALGLAAERDLGAALMGFLEQVKTWAAPSAILAAIREPGSESGWRLLPVLSAGSGPLGVERTLPQLVQEAPECLERPTLVRPREEVPGVRPRDNCVVPWWHDGESGILVLRGVPRPCPPNLPEAVALLSTPLWPRLVGGSGQRVEAGLVQLQRLAEKIREDASRHIEGLKTVTAAPSSGADPAELAALREQLDAARLEAQGASAARDEAKARMVELQRAREEAAVNARAVDTALGLARRELTEARQETQRAILELEDFRERHTALEKTLRTAEADRDRLKDELARASARPAAAVDAGQLETARKAQAAAEEQARRLVDQQQQAEVRARAAEERRHEAEQRRQAADEELHKLRQDLAAARPASGESADSGAARPLEEVRRALEAQVRAAEERGREADRLRQAAEEQLTRARQELAEANQASQSSTLEVSRLADRLKEVEPALGAAEADRDRGRAEIERLTTRLESLRADLSSVTEQLAATKRSAAEARAARGESPAKAPSSEPSTTTDAAPGAVVEALRGALAVLRRTPFVPPGLRVAMQEARDLVSQAKEPQRPWLHIVLLDRDAASVEPVAAELEEAGLDVRIANYPEELALLMKTPDARDLNAVVCDVLAFRADQNVAGLFRSWQKDRPSLALYLSFASDNPNEAERAKRVPLSLTAGRFGRPLIRQEVVDMLTPLARRPETT